MEMCIRDSTGGQLIEVYRDYLHTHEKSLYDLLILHNEDDLKGMPAILPILSYADFFSSPLFPQAPELWAVSYTHLDVYKRQCQNRSMIHGISQETTVAPQIITNCFRALSKGSARNMDKRLSIIRPTARSCLLYTSRCV